MQRYGAMWASWDVPTRLMWVGIGAAAAIASARIVWRLTH